MRSKSKGRDPTSNDHPALQPYFSITSSDNEKNASHILSDLENAEKNTASENKYPVPIKVFIWTEDQKRRESMKRLYKLSAKHVDDKNRKSRKYKKNQNRDLTLQSDEDEEEYESDSYSSYSSSSVRDPLEWEDGSILDFTKSFTQCFSCSTQYKER